MTLVVNPWHWLTPEGEIPTDAPAVRRNVLRVARVIEYGATLPVGGLRQTLIECSKRPAGMACQGLLLVKKQPDASLIAFCPACGTDHFLVYKWQGTRWSQGQPKAVSASPASDKAYR